MRIGEFQQVFMCILWFHECDFLRILAYLIAYVFYNYLIYKYLKNIVINVISNQLIEKHIFNEIIY